MLEAGMKAPDFTLADKSGKQVSLTDFQGKKNYGKVSMGVVRTTYVIDALINSSCKDQDAVALIRYISDEEKEEKLLMNQQVLKTPIVRNGKLATVGYQPDIWKTWK